MFCIQANRPTKQVSHILDVYLYGESSQSKSAANRKFPFIQTEIQISVNIR